MGQTGWAVGVAVLVLGCGRVEFQRMPPRDGGRDGAVAGLDTGPIEMDTGPAGLDTGPVETDTGPVEMDTGPIATDTGPIEMDTGPTDAGRCAARCEVEGPRITCDAFGTTSSAGDQHVITLDMAGLTTLDVVLTVCEPTGFTFHVGDSPTNDGGGGDAGSTSNDSEVVLEGSMLSVFPSDLLRMPGAVRVEPAWASGAPCVTRHLFFRDQAIASVEPPFELLGPEFLRLDPPTDTEGTPDAIWYVGVNRTIGRADRSGTGVTSLALCAN